MEAVKLSTTVVTTTPNFAPSSHALSTPPSPSPYYNSLTPSSITTPATPSALVTIGEVWYLFLILIIVFLLVICITEYYKYQERNDPNSAYSRRQRRMEREESLREYRRAILRNAERRRRDWNMLWDEEGGMMRRDLKREYILSRLCIKVYENETKEDKTPDSPLKQYIDDENNDNSNIEYNIDHKQQNRDASLDQIQIEIDYTNQQEHKDNDDDDDDENNNNNDDDDDDEKKIHSNILSGNSTRSNRSPSRYTRRRPEQQHQQLLDQDLQRSTNSKKSRLHGMVANVLSLTSSTRSRLRINRQQREQQQQYDDENFSKRTCGICLEDYEIGEEICIHISPPPPDHDDDDDDDVEHHNCSNINGRNDNPCNHIFHADCMLQWLMKKKAEGRCPLCRKTYLSMEEYENHIQFQQHGGGITAAAAAAASRRNDVMTTILDGSASVDASTYDEDNIPDASAAVV